MKSVTQLIDSHQGFSIANFQVGFQATFRQEALHKIDTQLLEPIFMTSLFCWRIELAEEGELLLREAFMVLPGRPTFPFWWCQDILDRIGKHSDNPENHQTTPSPENTLNNYKESVESWAGKLISTTIIHGTTTLFFQAPKSKVGLHCTMAGGHHQAQGGKSWTTFSLINRYWVWHYGPITQ